MIDLLHFIRDTDLFVYYVFCYGMLICGGGFILSFLAMCFCAVLCKIEENRVCIEIHEGKPGTGMSLNYVYPLEIIDSDSDFHSDSDSDS